MGRGLAAVAFLLLAATGCGDDGEGEGFSVLDSYELPALVMSQAMSEARPGFEGLCNTYAGEQGAGFHCRDAGHWSGGRITGFRTASQAEAEFAAAATGAETHWFHGFRVAVRPAFGWPAGGRNEEWTWRVGCWVIRVYAFDDTPYQIAVAPEETSQAIYAAAMERRLFSVCLVLVNETGFGSAMESTRTPLNRSVRLTGG